MHRFALPDERTLSPWSPLVVKDGVALGGMPALQQRLALALVWATLPGPEPMSEPQLNAALKAALAGPAAWLDTDHVELRRWLVDAGWLQRDGFGREYRVLAPRALPAALHDAALPLVGVDVAAWVASRRNAAASQRAARRAMWEAARAA